MKCMMSCTVAAALLGGSTYLSLNGGPNTAAKVFVETLDPRQQSLYQRIVAERRSIYNQGLLLGVVLAVLGVAKFRSRMGLGASFCLGTAMTLIVAIVYYLLHPKSEHMQTHLTTPQHRSTWIDISRRFRVTYMCGLALGAAAGGVLSSTMCGA